MGLFLKKKPLYQIITEDIISQIQSGLLKPGDQIMTEIQLCEKYNISRMTVNKAISVLATQGYITRTAGKGSFVQNVRITKNIGDNVKSSFSNDITSNGNVPGAKLLEYKILFARDIPMVSRELNLEPDEMVHYIYRLRTSDGVPIALSHTYIPCKKLPALDVTCLEKSLYQYLDETYDIHPRVKDYYFNALLSTQEQQELLHTDSCALLRSSHSSTNDVGELFEYTETYYVGSRYTYHFSNF